MDFESQKKVTNYIGNSNLFELIITKLNNKTLHNSILLYGNQGIGKSTFVYYLAKNYFSNIDINSNKIDINNSHDSNLISNNSHPNFRVIIPYFDEKKKLYKSEITIEQIRQLNDFINFTNKDDKNKIILIDSVDYLNLSSSNSLLKILEEPKKNLYFFLISHNPNKILSTIQSRCIKFKFSNHNFENFRKIIDLSLSNYSETEIQNLYNFTNGSPGISIEYLDNDYLQIKNNIIDLFLENELLSKNLIDFSKSCSKNITSFNIFIFFIRYVLTSCIKYKIGIHDIQDGYLEENIMKISKIISDNKIFIILDYINENEKNINIYNLDKKMFIINFFSKLSQNLNK